MGSSHFSLKILEWYSLNKRELPWRTNPTPYHVLVSEIMLQQTQVSRVIEKFAEFTARFPTVQDLAKASTSDVIHAWSGMGYNRRALLLHKFAQEVMEKYAGIIPNNPQQLIELPGIGPYAAGSIAAFAFNQPSPAIDVNVRRIYLRFFQGKDQGTPLGKKEERELYQLVKTTIPLYRSRDLHNALMDFGSVVCMRNNPSCSVCILKTSCQFFPLYQNHKEEVLFVKEKKIEKGVYEQSKFIPNRIFRGRIVEFVRQNEAKEISFEELGKYIKKDYQQQEQEWLLILCQGLKRDKLLDFQQKSSTLLLWFPK